MHRIGKFFLLLSLVASTVSSVTLISSTSSFSQIATPELSPIASKISSSSSLGTNIFLPHLQKSHTYSNSVLPFGIQMSDLGNSQALSLAQGMGPGWIRVGLSWSRLEPSNTTSEGFEWSVYDGGFAAAAQAGIQPIVAISGNPSWAASISCGPIDPAYLQDYASFLQALVGRYSAAPYNVHYWELYNEPDNSDMARSWLGGCWGGKGKEYGDMLKVAYPAIKSADPQAQVVLGSLAYDWFLPSGPFDRAFLDDILGSGPNQAHAGAYFDVMGFHYYPAFRADWEGYGTDVIGKTNYLRNKLASFGVSKPIVVTELNQWSKSPEGNGGSDEEQSDYVVQAFARSMAAELRFSIWFTLADYNEWGYGLLNQDLTVKPSYTTYRALSNMMAGAVYRGPMTINGSRPSNVEGYTFTMPGSQERHVMWVTAPGTVRLSFPGSSVVVTDKNGSRTSVSDSADGAMDGLVTVTVTGRPIYLDVTP